MLVENSTPVASTTSIRVARVMAFQPDMIVATRCVVVKVMDIQVHVREAPRVHEVVPDVRSLHLVAVRVDPVTVHHLVQIAPLHCERENL